MFNQSCKEGWQLSCCRCFAVLQPADHDGWPVSRYEHPADLTFSDKFEVFNVSLQGVMLQQPGGVVLPSILQSLTFGSRC